MFTLFSITHLLNLLGYSLLFIFLYFSVAHSQHKKRAMRDISIVILLIKCGELFIRHKFMGEALSDILPLHLCNITLVLAILGCIFDIKPFIHIVFFWSIGALFAVIFPEVKVNFPNFFNISFFTTHFYVIFVSVVEYRLFNLRPTLSTWFGSLFGLNVIAFIVFFINKSLGTNYLFINGNPPVPIDQFGPWPYYIIVLEILYMLLTFLILLLFKKKNFKNRSLR